jgi:ribonuclease HI
MFPRVSSYHQSTAKPCVTTSLTDALDANAFLLPALLTVSNWRHKAMVWLAMLPNEHPLSKITRKRMAGKTKRHKSPINSLLGEYRYSIKEFEKIPAVARDPMTKGKLPFKVSITENREESVNEAASAREEVQIYTDSSAINGKVGAAAILTRPGSPLCTLHLHLGPESEHTVHEVELVGILLGMQLISTEKHRSTMFAIGVDNQAAIKAFQSAMRSLGHHLAREIIKTASKIQRQRSRRRYVLTIRWTAGHEGIEGNEAADTEAKRAVEGLSLDKRQLPQYLRKHLPINPVAAKRVHYNKLKNRWKAQWRGLERG